VGAGGGEVDVWLGVGGAVAAAAIACCDADGDAQCGGVDERLVQGGPRLAGPLVFALPPADAQSRGGGGGMDGGGDGVEEAAVGVGGEVDDDRRLGGQCTGDFDVEQHLPVGALRVLTGDVARSVDADCPNGRGGKAQTGEVGVEIGLGVAAAELDDRHALAGAVGPGREVVGLAELQRGVGHPCRVRAGAGEAEVCPGLRPVIDAEYGDEHAVEFGRHAQFTGTVPVLDRQPGHRVKAGRAGQRCTESSSDGSRRAEDLHPAGGLVDPVDDQPGSDQHRTHQIHVDPVRTVAGTQMGVAHRVRSLDEIDWHRCPTAQHHRQLDSLAWIDWAPSRPLRHRPTGAARNGTASRLSHGIYPHPGRGSPASI